MLAGHLNYNQALKQFASMGWKEKLDFYSQVEVRMDNSSVLSNLKWMEYCWTRFLRETNVNVLIKAVNTLNKYTKVVGFKNIRAQIEVIKILIDLSKMKKTQIDENTVSIVASMLRKEQYRQNDHQIVKVSESAYRASNYDRGPSYLTGCQIDCNPEDVQVNEGSSSQIIQCLLSQSLLLDVVAKQIKNCKAQTFLLCLKIITKMKQEHLIAELQMKELSGIVEKINKIIFERKCRKVTSKDQNQLRPEIKFHLQLLKQRE